jgi:sugar/nucleoside kinase (ribokinase family)
MALTRHGDNSGEAGKRAIDYLVVGHLCDDVFPGGRRVGGSAAYAGLTAEALGYQGAVVTSAAPEMEARQILAGLRVRLVNAGRTTRFENRSGAHGWREQRLFGRAVPLHAGHVPRDWRGPAILHLAPVAGEVDPAMLRSCNAAFKGLTPQGWLRRWDGGGRIRPRFWPSAREIFSQADAVVLSEEDLSGGDALAEYRRWSPVLVVTQGYRGCTVFRGGEARVFPVPRVIERDPTGAGDIFAAAFFIALQRWGDPWTAAGFANAIAAPSVAVEGLPAKMAEVRNVRPLFWGPMASTRKDR